LCRGPALACSPVLTKELANNWLEILQREFPGVGGFSARHDFAAKAPLNLVLVADTTRMTVVSEEDIGFYKGADAGFISQNIHLFCASEGLATVVRASVDQGLLGKALNLKEHQRIVLAQSVGYPAGHAQKF